MITKGKTGSPAHQSGVVLLIALIVLIAMTLGAFSLIRSVNTTNLISGNLAFRESAILNSERATESALSGLLIPGSAAGKTVLHTNSAAGYWAKRADPADGQSWETFWESLKKARTDPEPAPIVIGTPDITGNAVSYVIHRLCDKEGSPYDDGVTCSEPPLTSDGDSKDKSKDPLATTKQVYYRITSRVTGPRNTVVYTQTIIAL
jgi:hypothetical protein